MNIQALNWNDDLEFIKSLDCKIVEVDGSVNCNPGNLGIAGIYDPQLQILKSYKYTGQRMTNQLLEILAIYHGLEYLCNCDKCIVVSDSLTSIRMLSNQINVKNERLRYLKDLIYSIFNDKTIYLVHRCGHTKDDIVGDYITKITQQYNKSQNINTEFGSLQYIIDKFGW